MNIPITYPTLHDLIKIAGDVDKKNNISVYDAEADEYYPVSMICRADNDVLDEGHIFLVIKDFTEESETDEA
jgi:hypothetical protein